MGITLGLGELHLVHPLASIPMQIRTTLVHNRKLKTTWVVSESVTGL
jgi:hypothetical protein